MIAAMSTELRARDDGSTSGGPCREPRDPARLQWLEAQRIALLAEALPTLLGPLDQRSLDAFDARARWVEIDRGEPLFREGDPARSWFVLAHGRLELTRRLRAGLDESVAEIGRGEVVGDAAVLAGVDHCYSAIALRDSVLLRFDGHVDALSELDADALRRAFRFALRRSLHPIERERPAHQCQCVAVVAARPEVALEAFCAQLAEQLGALGPLSHQRSDGALGPTAEHTRREEHPAWLDFAASIDALGERHRFVLLEGDRRDTIWNRRILAEADHVLLLADASSSPVPHALERSLFEARSTRHARRTLVLSHSADTALPSGTSRWLRARDVQQHRHVRRGRVEDIASLARSVAGRSVGVVLGGGGARGFAHVGALRALEEGGIAVDQIAGASIGAVAAAHYAMARSSDAMRAAADRAVASGPLSDFTLPLTSLLRGRRMESIIRSLFGEVCIEDLWLPFFCNACDISRFEEVLFERGLVADALLASAALPGVLPPRVVGGRILVDGGTSDTLPGARMRARCPGTLIAVDVSRERAVDYPAERYPTSLRALWEHVRPGGIRTPLLPELFLRAASFSVPGRVDAVATDAELFLRPPVEHFGTGDVASANALVRIGYDYTRERLRGFVPLHARRT